MEELSMGTIHTDETCQIFPLKFQSALYSIYDIIQQWRGIPTSIYKKE